MKFDNIICPVDFSDASVKAFEFACMLGKIKNTCVRLVHAYDRPYYSVASAGGGITYAVDGEANAEIHNYIAGEFHKLTELEFAQGLEIDRKFITDVPAFKFHEKLDLRHADFIVMGTKGHTGLLHGGLIGTNTERVIRHAPIPVVSVPLDCRIYPVKKILFATDFQDNILELFGHVNDFAVHCNAEVIVGMINTKDNFTSTQFAREQFVTLKTAFPKLNMTLEVHNNHTIHDGISELSLVTHADMLAMVTHGRTGFARLFSGSLVEDIASDRFITLPLLTLKQA